MESPSYKLHNFKCFTDAEIELNKITLLTGSNGTGKSSLIQALLLVRIALEKAGSGIFEHDDFDNQWVKVLVPLNDLYELKLGSVYQLFNLEKEADNFLIELADEKFRFSLAPESAGNDVVEAYYPVSIPNGKEPFWRQSTFNYLHTERIGPRLDLDAHHTDFIHCGYRGELTGQVLYRFGLTHKIVDQRAHNAVKSQNLQQHVDVWLADICPGTRGVVVEQFGVARFQIRLRSSGTKQEILAPNIGFGISYALPIIVQGLISKPESVLIVENPEAHLHPKGQSSIGYFLGLVAAAGVKVIIETHSEHVVNGVRRAALSGIGLRPEEMNIYFFKFGEQGHEYDKIVHDEHGEMSDFPVDFFDQANQDLATIMSLRNK
ncbi:MAG: DUF3696 domain-containing protein [Mucilaginibacter sp.]